MNKTAIKKFAIEARKKLMASVSDKAGMIGITAKDFQKEPITKGADFEIFKTVAGTEVTLNKNQCEQRKLLVKQMEDRGFDAVIEEVAYTWFNRICVIRFMEVNDYLPTRVRVLSSEKDGKTEPDIVTQALEIDLGLTDKEKEEVLDLKLKSDSQSQDELFKKVFIKQCNKLHEVLPELFEETEDYTEMLLSLSYTNKDEVIYMLVNPETGIAEADFNVTTVGDDGEVSGQVEIIGWLYQYYISEKHNNIVNLNKGTVKKEDIPAATQLFTTDWVVRYMVDNSLGKYWIERNPESRLVDKLKYFVTPKDGHINYINEKINPTDLTFFDPCMGSGHILVYAFDVLMEIYRECGYSDRDAALNIVQFNLFGLDIDKRAYQLSYFAIMMKARSYNRRALTAGVFNNVAAIEESNGIDKFYCEGVTTDKEQNQIGEYLVKAFMHAREIGSLQTIEGKNYKTFTEYLLNLEHKEVQLNLFSTDWIQNTLPLMLKLTKQASILSNKFTVVCTNPPYMNKLEGQLKQFVVHNYKDYSGDLFSVFIYRNFDFCVESGYSAFMTPLVWMFIQTYEKLREFVLNAKEITSLIQFEYSAFEEATVPICSFILKNKHMCDNGSYIRLTNYKGGMEIQKRKMLLAITEHNSDYFELKQDNLKKIPGFPIAYWIGEKTYDLFLDEHISDFVYSKAGIVTGEDKIFLRLWYELPIYEISFDCDEYIYSENITWVPMNKGGGYRKYYGNYEYVMDIYNLWTEGKTNKSVRRGDTDSYYKEAITWSMVTSNSASFRYSKNKVFGVAAPAIFQDKMDWTLLGYLNSKVVKYFNSFLNPTINILTGNIMSLPYKRNMIGIADKYVVENMDFERIDWDSYETSWDFKIHPLVMNTTQENIYIEEKFNAWKTECIHRFNIFKNNEESLNHIFIEIYELQNELTSEVEDKDVTVRKADLQSDIKSLISYAVGCMVGRYSLDNEGLIFAGGNWDNSKYNCFIPDEDNIIPITDEEYFLDDIVGRFIEFVKTVYGETTLEENLDFIANVLNSKGDTSREIIRNYFMKDFFADHCKVYQKRPIYWLFDSGKENGFKALIYLHRYDADTVGRVRTDYLHKEQSYVEAALRSAEYTIDNSSSSSEKSKATKAVAKYTKQLAEMKLYDEAIAHIANQRIELDLDDGVKVNYEKFQGIEVFREGQKAVKIDLLAKIK